jgi:hypothetical protein
MRQTACHCCRWTASTSTVDVDMRASCQLPLSDPTIKALAAEASSPPPLHHFSPVEVSHPDRSPPSSHRIDTPFVDSSYVAHLRDHALALLKLLSPDSPSVTLPCASRARKPPTTGESRFLSPLVTRSLLLQVTHARAVLVQLENHAWETSSSSSRLSAPVRTPLPGVPF